MSDGNLILYFKQITEETNGVRVVANKDQIDSWIERDIDACSIIFYNIEPTFQTAIEGSATSNEMWNRLTLQYAQVAVANSAHMLGMFHQYRMNPDHSIMAHVNRLRMMADELKSVNSPISDESLVVRILQTLPPSYLPFLSAWDSVPKANQTVANLTGRLVTEELRSKMRGGPDDADLAFFATHPSRLNHQQQSEANSAQGRGFRGNNFNNRGGYSNYRGGQHNYRGGQHNQRGGQPSYRGGQRGRGGRGCWHCGMTNHKAYNCRNKKDDERKEARNDQFDKNRDYDSNNDSNNSFAAMCSLDLIARKPTD